ncbi:hypothetical protein AY599_20980 [Leptolyngbya valderiana BDU 20041]|nr:hypothetical protein AY599_20980 [Leptolyngbya valderiana BDU 20041]
MSVFESVFDSLFLEFEGNFLTPANDFVWESCDRAISELPNDRNCLQRYCLQRYFEFRNYTVRELGVWELGNIGSIDRGRAARVRGREGGF